MIQKKYLQNALIGGVAVLFGGTKLIPNPDVEGPAATTAIAIVTGSAKDTSSRAAVAITAPAAKSKVVLALESFQNTVGQLSSSHALEDAFRSYFAYKAAHPNDVKKPYLYFVDYGLPSTTPRGYVFDMDSLKVVDGPFMVAHGRGSSTSQYGVPTRFSNASGSNATSLGLYVAEQTYAFHGRTGGQSYSSIGLKLEGVSTGYNDNAHARGVVAHGAPYVTPMKAGRSEGCPAMEPARAQRLLPKLANGAMVFLYAPNEQWLERDPWVTASAN